MKKLLVAATAMALSTAAFANSAGDHSFHVGALIIKPKNVANEVKVKTPLGVNGTGNKAEVEQTEIVGFGYDYFISDNLSVGVQLGTPPQLEVISESTGQVVGSVRQMSPEFKVKYLFGTPKSSVRPFMGVGVAYVKFNGVISDPAFVASLGADTDIDPEVGPLLFGGVQFNIDKDVFFNASVAYMKLEPTIEFPDSPLAPSPQVKVFADAVVNPIIVNLSVGRSF